MNSSMNIDTMSRRSFVRLAVAAGATAAGALGPAANPFPGACVHARILVVSRITCHWQLLVQR